MANPYDGIATRVSEIPTPSPYDGIATRVSDVTDVEPVGFDVNKWAQVNLGQATRISGIDAPSRKDFLEAGLPKANRDERAKIASKLKANIIPIVTELPFDTEYTPPSAPPQVKPKAYDPQALNIPESAFVGMAEASAGTAKTISTIFSELAKVGNNINEMSKTIPIDSLMGIPARIGAKTAQFFLQGPIAAFVPGGGEVTAKIPELAKRFHEKNLQGLAEESPAQDITRDPSLLLDPSWWTRSLASTFTSMSQAVAFGGGSPTGAALVGASLEAVPQFDELRKEGVGTPEAFARSVVFGAIVASLERIGFKSVLGKGAGPLIKRFLTTGAVESITEGLEEPASVITGALGRVSKKEFVERLAGSVRSAANVMVPAFFTGGATTIAQGSSADTGADTSTVLTPGKALTPGGEVLPVTAEPAGPVIDEGAEVKTDLTPPSGAIKPTEEAQAAPVKGDIAEPGPTVTKAEAGDVLKEEAAVEEEEEKPTSPYDTLRVREHKGTEGNKSHTTRTEEGTIPTESIAGLKGEMGEVRGEHRNRKGEAWDEFKQSIKDNGIKEPILILKDPGSPAVISEGNHRLDAAIELGLKEVPVDIRYFGKSESEGLAYKPPAPAPKKKIGQKGVTKKAAVTTEVEKPTTPIEDVVEEVKVVKQKIKGRKIIEKPEVVEPVEAEAVDVQVGDDVKWTDGSGHEATSTIQKITDGVAQVEWFGRKQVPVEELTLSRKSDKRKSRELKERFAANPEPAVTVKTITSPRGERLADKKQLSGKEQKGFLLEEIDKALKTAPEVSSPDQLDKTLRFEVPGDGTFTIQNNQKALTEFRKRIDARFPTKTPGPTTLKRPSDSPTPYKSLVSQMAAAPELIDQYKIQLENEVYTKTDTANIENAIAEAQRLLKENDGKPIDNIEKYEKEKQDAQDEANEQNALIAMREDPRYEELQGAIEANGAKIPDDGDLLNVRVSGKGSPAIRKMQDAIASDMGLRRNKSMGRFDLPFLLSNYYKAPAKKAAPPAQSVGAAAADEGGTFQPKAHLRQVEREEVTDFTGLRESIAETERRVLGYPEEVKDAARRFPEVVDEAWARIKKNPDTAQNLIDELTEQARPLSDVDVAILSIAKVQRFNARNEAAAKTIELANSEDEAAKAKAQKDYQAAAVSLEELFDVAARGEGKSITETARGLSALRMVLSDRFELVEMEQAVRDKQGDKPLSDKQRNEIKDLKAEYDATLARLTAEQDRLRIEAREMEEELANAQANKTFEDVVKAVFAGTKPTFSQKMLAVADRLEAEALASMEARAGRVSAGVDPTVLIDMSKLGAAYIIRGSVSLAEWTSKMRAAVGPDISDSDLEAVRKASFELVADKLKTDDVVAEGEKGEATSIKDLFKIQAEAGIDNLDTALDNVYAIVKESRPDVTRERVRDEFSDYGKGKPLTTDPAKLILADLRRQAQLVASIERVAAKLAPLKTGSERAAPSQKARDLTRKLHSMMKEAGIVVVDPARQLASSLSTMKTRLKNSINDMEVAIQRRERLAENVVNPVSDAEVKALQARRDELKSEYDKIFPKAEATDAQLLNKAIKIAERNLDYWNKRVKDARSGKFGRPKTEGRVLPFSAALAAITEQKDAAVAEVASLKELANPKRSPEQIAIDNKKARLERSTIEMQRRIKENDFTPRSRHVVDISNDPAALQALARNESVKLEFLQMKERARWSTLSTVEKVGELAVQVYDMARNIAYSADDSFLGRQGWFFMLSHPKQWGKAGVSSMKAFSQKSSQKSGEAHLERENSRNGIYDKMKLALNIPDRTGNYDSVDDMFRLNLTRSIPVLGTVVDASGRSFATASNEIRTDFADFLLGNTKVGREIQANPKNLTQKQKDHLENIGWGVNVLTGRGNLPHAEGAARVLGAPRFIKSSIDTILHRPILRPLLKGDFAAAGSFAIEYLKVYAAVSAMYIVSGLFRDPDEEIEWDLRSSKWGDIPLKGGYSINPLAVIAPQLRMMARLISGQKKTGKGIINLRESWLPFATAEERLEGVPYGQSQWADFGGYLRTKAHPGINAAAGILTGTDFWGNPQHRGLALLGAFSPISPVQAYEALQAKGVGAGVGVGLAEFFGFNTKPDFNDPDIMRQVAGSEEAFNEKISKLLYDAAAPGADSDERVKAKKLIKDMFSSGMTKEDALSLIAEKQKSDGGSLNLFERGGKRTSYGRRVRALNDLLNNEQPADPKADALHLDSGNAFYRATETKSSDKSKVRAQKFMTKMSLGEQIKAMRSAVIRNGGSTISRTDDGKLTSYGKRLAKLRQLNDDK